MSESQQDTFTQIWAQAEENYAEQSGRTLPGPTGIEPAEYLARVKQEFEAFRNKNEKLRSTLNRFSDIVESVASVLGHALKLVRKIPPFSYASSLTKTRTCFDLQNQYSQA